MALLFCCYSSGSPWARSGRRCDDVQREGAETGASASNDYTSGGTPPAPAASAAAVGASDVAKSAAVDDAALRVLTMVEDGGVEPRDASKPADSIDKSNAAAAAAVTTAPMPVKGLVRETMKTPIARPSLSGRSSGARLPCLPTPRAGYQLVRRWRNLTNVSSGSAAAHPDIVAVNLRCYLSNRLQPVRSSEPFTMSGTEKNKFDFICESRDLTAKSRVLRLLRRPRHRVESVSPGIADIQSCTPIRNALNRIASIILDGRRNDIARCVVSEPMLQGRASPRMPSACGVIHTPTSALSSAGAIR